MSWRNRSADDGFGIDSWHSTKLQTKPWAKPTSADDGIGLGSRVVSPCCCQAKRKSHDFFQKKKVEPPRPFLAPFFHSCVCVCACVCVYRRCECCPGDGAGWGSCQHLETLSTPEVLPCVKTNYTNFRKIFIFFREFFCVFFYTRQHLWCRQRFKKNVVPTPWICKYALLLYLSQMYYKHTHTHAHTHQESEHETATRGATLYRDSPPPPLPCYARAAVSAHEAGGKCEKSGLR